MKPEPHRAHLAEMRLSIFERRREDWRAETLEFAARIAESMAQVESSVMSSPTPPKRKAARRG